MFDCSANECLKDMENGTINYNKPPYLCSSPIKVTMFSKYAKTIVEEAFLFPASCLTITSLGSLQFKYANSESKDYLKTGNGSLSFRLINQRADFAFGYFSGNLSDVSYSCMQAFEFLR